MEETKESEISQSQPKMVQLKECCSHEYKIGDEFLQNCKLCGIYLPKVSLSFVNLI